MPQPIKHDLLFPSEKEIDALFSAMRGKHIAVVGDLMLDKYIWGAVTRISPEAPVPIVHVANESECLGGAANVSNNLHHLGATAIPIGVVGEDLNGDHLIKLAQEAGFRTDGIIRDAARPTTVKSRVIAHNQHVVRVDREDGRDIEAAVARRIIGFLESIANDLDAIIIEDYNKGLLTAGLIESIIALAKQRDIPVTVDPKFSNFMAYKDVTVMKPNRKEIEEALAIKIEDETSLHAAAQKLKERLACANALITLGEKGMFLLDDRDRQTTIPTVARRVHDVSGAGDTVIATLTLALAAGSPVVEAAYLANHAAGVVVGEIGAVPITPEDLKQALLSTGASA